MWVTLSRSCSMQCVFNNLIFRYAAKSCDEIGRLAAVLAVTGDWDEETDIDRDTMKIRWK